jgi:hypothetical protein
MAKTGDTANKQPDKKTVPDKKTPTKRKNNGSSEVAERRLSGKDKISKDNGKPSSGAALVSWPKCNGCKKKMVYDENSGALWYCKTCDGYGHD